MMRSGQVGQLVRSCPRIREEGDLPASEIVRNLQSQRLSQRY